MKACTTLCAAGIFALLILFSNAAAETSAWPQWRESERDGQVHGAPWPDKLDTNHLRREDFCF